MVFQNYALYPHMSVFDNLAFPLRAQRLPRAELRLRVEQTAKLLGLEELLRRKPRALSGGQRQRVAMGRAIVREPKVFLMDEPLSNLDAQLRTQMRAEIAGLQRELGVTTMYVTHDQVEAMTMGTRIAVLRDGVLQQLGPPQQLYDRPDNLFVAAFIGSPAMSLLEARIERDGNTLQCVLADQRLPIASANESAAALAARVGVNVAVGLRAEHLGEADGSRPGLRGRVKFVELLGADRLIQLELGARPVSLDGVPEESVQAVVTARFATRMRLEQGDLVDVGVAADRLHFFDLESGRAIR